MAHAHAAVYEGRIVVADDEPATVERIVDILRSNGCAEVADISCVHSLADLTGYDIAFVDIVWPARAIPAGEEGHYFGITALRFLRQHNPSCRIALMSKHLFDLEVLSEIQEADAYMRSDAPGSQILSILGEIVATERSVPLPKIGHVPAFVLRKTLDCAHVDVSGYFIVIEQALLDGRPDLFGLNEKEHRDALQEVRDVLSELRQLKAESQKSATNRAAWKTRIDVLTGLFKGCKNLLDVLEVIKRAWGF